ncbi:ATP-dependent 6-phosphofructokinase [Sphingomonas limnosediminicola]|uniref:ATP-dependent 6-phosphofructokinase n=1 Tax=Sphingomonas limnosediminicola TaxID=940133 RepID=A0ABP7LV31_9SPHN
MTASAQRIAINIGSGYVPGLDVVVAGATLAANELGVELVGIRDGYDGLLYPERYPGGGMVSLSPEILEADGHGGSLLGTAARTDPFNVRTLNDENSVEEVDRSGDVLEALNAAGIDGVISLVGGSTVTGLHALSVAFKLHRQGLRTVCVPKSVENEISSVPQAFGYNSVLSHTAETLERIRAAALDIGRLAVVEVPGQHSGWLALQSGLAAVADAILLPEIPYDLAKVADTLTRHEESGRRPALVVVAEGARPVNLPTTAGPDTDGMRASLTPNADPELGEGEHTIDRAGAAAKSVGVALQRLTNRDILPLSLGDLVRGGLPTAVDRQLGLAYGAGAVRALHGGEDGVMVMFDSPDLKTIPMVDALKRVRTVPAESELMQIARGLGIAFGD